MVHTSRIALIQLFVLFLSFACCHADVLQTINGKLVIPGSGNDGEIQETIVPTTKVHNIAFDLSYYTTLINLIIYVVIMMRMHVYKL